MTVVIWTLVILAALYMFLIMPRITPRPMHEFKGWYYAHRGFHDNKTDAPENSAKAMRLAVEQGYGIELLHNMTEQMLAYYKNTK